MESMLALSHDFIQKYQNNNTSLEIFICIDNVLILVIEEFYDMKLAILMFVKIRLIFNKFKDG